MRVVLSYSVLCFILFVSFNYSFSQVAMIQTQESQAPMDADKAFDLLKQGNKRFVAGNPINTDYKSQIKKTAAGQYPFAVILSCMDSRVTPEIIFDQGMGDIFVIRVGGNTVDDDVLGSLEFACKIAGAKLIVVLGHTNCGAIMGACDSVNMGNLSKLVAKIKPSVDKTETTGERSSKNAEFVNDVSAQNVNDQLDIIRRPGTILDDMINKQEIGLIGAMYDVETGKVHFYTE